MESFSRSSGRSADEFDTSPTRVSTAIVRHGSMPDDVLEAVEHHLEPNRAPTDLFLAAIAFSVVHRIEQLGHPDIRSYLMEQRDFLFQVEGTVRATFSAEHSVSSERSSNCSGLHCSGGGRQTPSPLPGSGSSVPQPVNSAQSRHSSGCGTGAMPVVRVASMATG